MKVYRAPKRRTWKFNKLRNEPCFKPKELAKLREMEKEARG